MVDARKIYGWGVIGPGRFARKFAADLRKTPRARCVAVASRDEERARRFADGFGFAKAYGDIDRLVEDDEIDVVHISVPHVHHRALAERAILAGKAVLCEKPLTPSAAESRALIEFAATRGVFLMEAMKTGFLPAVRKAKEWIDAGAIGEPLVAQADFRFRGPLDPEDRLMNPDLAGGAVLDIGIYPIHLTRFLLGEITRFSCARHAASTGVEDTAAILAEHAGGASSLMSCSFRTEEAMVAVIDGTDGRIVLPRFHAAMEALLWRDGEVVEHFKDEISVGMLVPEINAVMDALDAGLTECPGHNHAETIRLAEIMDEVRLHPGASR